MNFARGAVWFGIAVQAALVGSCSDRALLSSTASPYLTDPSGCEPGDCSLSEALVQEVAAGFLHDVGFRRLALEASLLNVDNTYARERLNAYAVAGGWESLPEFDPPSATLYVGANDQVEVDEYRDWSQQASLIAGDDESHWSIDHWLTLGQLAFFRYPTQRLPQLEQVVSLGKQANRAAIEEVGLWIHGGRALGGLVSVRYADGSDAIAVTCATCHAQGNDEDPLNIGAPSRIDLSNLDHAGWGPGRIDVTADGVDNPVAIADLRATRVQRRLHHTGNLENSLAALAVRVETLLITNQLGAVRPPRALAYALAAYIWSLGADLASKTTGLERAKRSSAFGAQVFEASCASCHDGAWGEGEWVSINSVKTDPLVAQSTARGTGGYRVPALLGFTERPLSHEARTTGLSAWLGGEMSAGARPGHALSTRGTPLAEDELEAVIAYLRDAFVAR